jgi:hypothetical protein
MLALTDEELDVVFNLARPLEPQLRDPFLRSMAAELQRYPETGVGLVFRVGKRVQRDFLRPPAAHGPAFMSSTGEGIAYRPRPQSVSTV